MPVNYKLLWPILAVSALTLSACSSSSSSGSNKNEKTVSQSGKVADGYLVDAKVCLDINDNKICDDGEPADMSAAGGIYSIDATDEQLDAHSILVEVIPGTTIDEDAPNTAIENAYTLTAPKGEAAFISPLTTMLQAKIESDSSIDAGQASISILTSLGLENTTVSLLEDYIDAKDNLGNTTELQENYTILHKVAQVTAQSMGANLDAIKDAVASSELALDLEDDFSEVNTVIMNEIIAHLAEIKTAIDDAQTFDPNTISQAVDSQVEITEVTQLVEDLSDGEIDLVEMTANSTITSTECSDASVTARFVYIFGSSVMYRVGSDNFDGCSIGESESQSINMLTLSSDYDIPFNCENYPICTVEDLNKTLNGGNTTYTHVKGSNIIIYTDIGGGGNTIVETITLIDKSVALAPFTKISASGENLTPGAEDGSCIADGRSDLVWQVDVVDEQRWGGEGADSGGNDYYSDWNTLISSANSDELCGYNDWRVPSLGELKSIYSSSVDVDAYFNNSFGRHWSSTINAEGFPYYCDIDNSDPCETGAAGGREPVRLVRGG